MQNIRARAQEDLPHFRASVRSAHQIGEIMMLRARVREPGSVPVRRAIPAGLCAGGAGSGFQRGGIVWTALADAGPAGRHTREVVEEKPRPDGRGNLGFRGKSHAYGSVKARHEPEILHSGCFMLQTLVAHA
jgi:hypothetical protein